MKVLYFGGQKCGKSSLAEKRALELSSGKKPYYIATYDKSYNDEEMQDRIKKHQNQRLEKFITIEEAHDFISKIEAGNTYLVDCLSMWILNEIKKDEKVLLEYLKKLETIDANIVFVLNDVSSGIIPFDKETRKFVDLTGIVGQKIVSLCDEVYEVKFSLENRLK